MKISTKLQLPNFSLNVLTKNSVQSIDQHSASKSWVKILDQTPASKSLPNVGPPPQFWLMHEKSWHTTMVFIFDKALFCEPDLIVYSLIRVWWFKAFFVSKKIKGAEAHTMQCNSLVRFQPRRRGCPSMWLLYHETVFKSMWFLAPSSSYNSIRGPS